MSKSSILIHSNYRPDNYGGIEAVVSQLIGLFDSHGISVKCFCGDVRASGKVKHKGQIVIYRRVHFKIAGAPVLSLGNLLFLWHARKVKVLIFQEPFPSLWPAVVVLRMLFRIRTIVLVHADPSANKFIKKIYGAVRSFVFKNAILVATSPNLLNKVISPSYAHNHLIPLSIPSHIKNQKLTLELPERYVLFVGRFSHYKGINYFLESIRDLPDVQFVIAGSGELEKNISQAIVKNKLINLLFINRYVTDAEKNELLHRCDFVVFPSISENEAFGIVQLEAMRFSKAIVNTWIDSGVNYVAPDGVCAITVPPCDSGSLAIAIKNLWHDHELSQRLGQAGNERFKLIFTDEIFNRNWTDLIKSVL